MDNIIKPRRSPRPRRQTALKALRDDAPATQNGATMEAPRYNDEANRPRRQRQVGDTPQIPAVDAFRARPALWTSALAYMPDGDRVVAPSRTALSTTNPRGTSADGRSACCLRAAINYELDDFELNGSSVCPISTAYL